MINGKEIRPCWSDLSIFISFHCQKEVEEEKKPSMGFIVWWRWCGVAGDGDILFNDSPSSIWFAVALMSQCENHNEMGKNSINFHI